MRAVKETNFNNGDRAHRSAQFGGLSTSTSTDNSTPTSIAASNAGHWEWASVTGNSNITHTVSLSANVAGSYAANTSQLIRVPQFHNVTVKNSGSIQAGTLGASGGGVLAFLATGTVDVQSGSTLSADGAGAAGGTLGASVASYSCLAPEGTGELAYPSGARKGDGVSFVLTGTQTNGRGNVSNSGGGGECQQAGGGGGANGGKGGLGGADNGGRSNRSGIGGAALTYSVLDHFAFGGGGGAGNQFRVVAGNTTITDATAGGQGGGVIMLRADTLSGTGVISANGATPPDNTFSNDGQGGGGAGGTVSIRTTNGASPCVSSNVQALGGAGHSTNTVGVGPGGGGGGGRIFIQSSDVACALAAATNTAGGSSGLAPISSAGDMALVATDGASNGDNGVIETSTSVVGGFCTTNATCNALYGLASPPRKKCDLSTNTCVQCLVADGNADCSFDSTKPTCDTNESCRGCTDNSPDCDGASGGSACKTGTGACVACVDNTTCVNKSCNTTTHSCINCDAIGNSGCSGSPTGSVCDAATHDCVACVLDTDCSGTPATPSCKSDNTCVACNTLSGDTGCNDYAVTKKCKPNGNCVQCLDATQCTATTPVCTGNACVGCTANSDCSAYTDTPICNTGNGQCVKCSGTADCQAISVDTPVCNANGSCSQCSTDLDCETNVGLTTPVCNLGTGNCLGCAGDSTVCDVSADRPICQGNGSCSGCSTNGQCQTRSSVTPLCNGNGSCAGCTTNTQCDTAYAALPVCSSGACVACGANSDCNVAANRPACSVAGCVGCDIVANGEANVCNPLGKHCETHASSPTSFKGQCVQCRSNTTPESKDCNGDFTNGLCDYSQDKCVACNSSVSGASQRIG